MNRLPYDDVRIIEKSATLTGRLIGLLFADQGAEVFVERAVDTTQGEHDDYLDRGKIGVPAGALADTSSADVIIVDGAASVSRAAGQIVLRVTAAIPGDDTYGDLAADCSEDLLNALVGIFTDMAGFGRVLGRPVIYTPLPICSLYAGVLGAIAAGAALVDRQRGGGREIVASRLAGGLSAIGALTLTSSGIPPHLAPASIGGGLPAGLTPGASTLPPYESFCRLVSPRRDSARSSRMRRAIPPGSCGSRSAVRRSRHLSQPQMAAWCCRWCQPTGV